MFKPLYDQVLVERVESETVTPGGLVLPGTSQEKSPKAVVMAVGPGRMLEDGTMAPLAVKTGDKVLLAKHHYTEIKVDGRDMIVVREDTILGVFE